MLARGAALHCTPAKEVANLVRESFISSWRSEESEPAAELPLESEMEKHDGVEGHGLPEGQAPWGLSIWKEKIDIVRFWASHIVHPGLSFPTCEKMEEGWQVSWGTSTPGSCLWPSWARNQRILRS